METWLELWKVSELGNEMVNLLELEMVQMWDNKKEILLV